MMSGVVAGKGGRPRDVQADEAILDATTRLLIEGGFGRLSVRAVAARAGVGKATIYRRWPSKTELLRATLARIDARETAEAADTGDLRGDLRALMRTMAVHFVDSEAAHLMPQLVAEAQFDHDLRELLHSYAEGRRNLAHQVLERARRRGELRVDVDPEVVVDLITAPVFIRKLITGGPITEKVTDGAVELIVQGIAR
jgi:AcrR family transcriptional regulator